MQRKIYKAVINPELESELQVDFMGLVDRPAIERNFLAFSEAKGFSVNEEKRIICGPAMIADMPLYRSDAKYGEYYVVFDKQAIRDIVEKFSAKGYMQNFNLFHNQNAKVSDVTIFNSFISDSEIGISPLKGFEDVAEGSWFISCKVNNDEVWDKVKSGEIKGFSVEGLFNYVPAEDLAFNANNITEEDTAFLCGLQCHNKELLSAAILVPQSSLIYSFAQKIIKAASNDNEQISQWLKEVPSVLANKLAIENAYNKISKILNETII
jgi:hypothetical protein